MARNLDRVRAAEAARKLAEEKAAVRKELRAKQRPFTYDPAITEWKKQYEECEMRYNMLIVRGASRIGKTQMAQSIFPNTLVTTVNGAGEPDLREFKRGFHQAVVLDQVNDLQFILNNRAVLQANAEDQYLGVTQSHNFSYEVWLHRIPIILTVDLEVNMEEFKKSDWLEHNCVLVNLGRTKTYNPKGPMRGPSPEPERDPLALRSYSPFEFFGQGRAEENRQLAARAERLGDLVSTLGPKEDPLGQCNEYDLREMAPEDLLEELAEAEYREGLSEGLMHDEEEEMLAEAGFPED